MADEKDKLEQVDITDEDILSKEALEELSNNKGEDD